MTPFERGATAIPFAGDAIPNTVPLLQLLPHKRYLHSKCSYLHDTKANAR